MEDRVSRAKKARQRAAEISTKVTPKMSNYLTILLTDCGFTTLLQRNSYLSRIANREIKFIDQLTFDEGQKLIDKLEERRDDQYDPREEDDDEYGGL